MSILIMDMEMPESCRECRVEQGYAGYRWCGAAKKFERTLDYRESRPDWCPLIHIQSHGDLIDRDVLLKKCEFVCTDDDEDIRAVRYNIIENAPTIIQAEEGE